MKENKTKTTWSAKKILFTFLIIGIILGLILSAYLIIVQMTNYNPEHEHLSTQLSCPYCENVEEYGNVYNYIFSFIKEEPLSWLGFILWFPLGAEGIATFILIIRGSKRAKIKKKENKEKISNSVTNILD